MRRIIFNVAGVCLIAALNCSVAWAQATAQISGTVRDQSGAVLPGVDVTVTQTETGIVRTTVSNEAGAFVLPNLPIGPYRLEATLSGFRTYAQKGIVLQVNSSAVVDPVMDLGTVAETVDVRATATLVETRNATVGTVVNNERILELPLNGRDVTNLITLAGGAVTAGAGRGASLVGADSRQISVAGGAGFGVEYVLDGANHVSFVTGSTMLMPFPDAMLEFKVEASGVSAQRASSTAVSAVTKSGTNVFHGSLFEFLRNDGFNAKPYFAAVDRTTGEKIGSTLKRNQFGGTLGGPVIRNRVFFFAGYQGTTLREDPANLLAFVPTPAMLAGDWTAFASPACNAGRQLTLRAPFVDNRIDPAQYSPIALAVVNNRRTPLPSPTNECGEVTYGNMTSNADAHYVGKLDYQATTNHSLFSRVFLWDFASENPRDFNTNLLQDTGYRESSQHSFTAGSTYVFGPTTVQAVRVAMNSTANIYKNVAPGELFTWCDLSVNVYCAPEVTRIQGLTISGGFTVNSAFLTGMQYEGQSFSANYDLTHVRGTHQLSFGSSAVRGQQDSVDSFVTPHRFNFTGAVTGAGLGDFLLGRPGSLITGRTNDHHIVGTSISLYGGDTWRINDVTLTYGLRWEPYLPQAPEAVANFDLDRFRQGVKTTVFVNAPAGLYYRGDPGFPDEGVNSRWWQFAPRLGAAWDVNGDGRLSVRASYARAYISLPGDYREVYSSSWPWGARIQIPSPVGGLADPWRGAPGGDIFPYEVNRNAPYASGDVYTQPYDLPNPANNSWNVSVQRQFGARVGASASYLGNVLENIWGNRPLNPAIYFPGGADANGVCVAQGYTLRTTPEATCSTLGNTGARRMLTLENPVEGAKYGFVTEADPSGVQTYHGMLLSLETRPTSTTSINANYTLSRCRGPYATLFSAMGAWPQDTYTHPDDSRFDDGACDSDRRHVFNLTTVGETPQFSNPTMRVLASGWRLAAIYNFLSGPPLSVFAGSDRALSGLAFSGGAAAPLQRADQVLDNPYDDRSGRPRSRYLNPAAFALPALGTLGNMERNSVTGPSTWSLDVALSRIFRVGTSHRLEFRTEAFNLTNSFRPGNPDFNSTATVPNNVLINPTFGEIRTALPPRILQFALKYLF